MMGSRTSFVSVGLFVCWLTHLQNVMLVPVVGSISVASQCVRTLGNVDGPGGAAEGRGGQAGKRERSSGA